MDNLKKEKEKGQTAILITLLVLGVLLLIAGGLSAIFVGEIKISSLIRQSAPAFYAADAGTEYALYQINVKGNNTNSDSFYLSIPAHAAVSWNTTGAISTGQYGQTQRRIQLTW